MTDLERPEDDFVTKLKAWREGSEEVICSVQESSDYYASLPHIKITKLIDALLVLKEANDFYANPCGRCLDTGSKDCMDLGEQAREANAKIEEILK